MLSLFYHHPRYYHVSNVILFLLITPVFLQGNGHHQVESHIRNKLDSLLKESRIGDKEDTDSFSIRALLRATHQGLQKNLRQVRRPEAMRRRAWRDTRQRLGGRKNGGVIKLGN